MRVCQFRHSRSGTKIISAKRPTSKPAAKTIHPCSRGRSLRPSGGIGPIEQLEPGQNVMWTIRARGSEAGGGRLVVEMVSDANPQAIRSDEPTTVIGTQQQQQDQQREQQGQQQGQQGQQQGREQGQQDEPR